MNKEINVTVHFKSGQMRLKVPFFASDDGVIKYVKKIFNILKPIAQILPLIHGQ